MDHNKNLHVLETKYSPEIGLHHLLGKLIYSTIEDGGYIFQGGGGLSENGDILVKIRKWGPLILDHIGRLKTDTKVDIKLDTKVYKKIDIKVGKRYLQRKKTSLTKR